VPLVLSDKIDVILMRYDFVNINCFTYSITGDMVPHDGVIDTISM